MEGCNLPKFEDWEAEKIIDPDFLAAAYKLEPGYQVAWLRLLRGLTQAQLAEMVGIRQSFIARTGKWHQCSEFILPKQDC